MQNYLLTVLILLPVIGAATTLVYGLTPGARESHQRWIALGFTTLAFLVSLLLLKGAGGGVGGFRFEENYSWIGFLGARYHVGVDGISLWLVMLTTLLMPISILSSWTAITRRQPTYYVLMLLLESFSYKEGIPLDADWVLDARMLPNPHYDPQLRPLTGKDAPVVEYLKADANVARWLEEVGGLLKRWLPEIVRENRSHVTVAIGCTGGRHRSVYLAEALARALQGDWRVLVRHRALSRQDGP